jgi:hypothetical protein
MQFSWIFFVKQICNECGFSNIWETEHFNNIEYLKCVIKDISTYIEPDGIYKYKTKTKNTPLSEIFQNLIANRCKINSPNTHDH